MVGRPNVGKSTLMNRMIGQKIAITSDKPQTTRNRIQTVYTDERGQMIFLDTPGIHKARTRLGDFMVETAERTLADADIILWLVEPSTYIGAGEQRIAALLREQRRPVFLIINKIDTLKDKTLLLEVIQTYKDVCPFAEVLPMSAMKDADAGQLRALIFQYLPEGPLYFDEDTVTEQPMRELAAELIREQALRKLKDEIPHGIAVVTEQMKPRKDGLWEIEASIVCEREAHKAIIIGKGGAMLKRIGTGARIQIEELVQGRVNLKLFVKVRKDWRDSELYLQHYGYRK